MPDNVPDIRGDGKGRKIDRSSKRQAEEVKLVRSRGGGVLVANDTIKDERGNDETKPH